MSDVGREGMWGVRVRWRRDRGSIRPWQLLLPISLTDLTTHILHPFSTSPHPFLHLISSTSWILSMTQILLPTITHHCISTSPHITYLSLSPSSLSLYHSPLPLPILPLPILPIMLTAAMSFQCTVLRTSLIRTSH